MCQIQTTRVGGIVGEWLVMVVMIHGTTITLFGRRNDIVGIAVD